MIEQGRVPKYREAKEKRTGRREKGGICRSANCRCTFLSGTNPEEGERRSKSKERAKQKARNGREGTYGQRRVLLSSLRDPCKERYWKSGTLLDGQGCEKGGG